MRKFRCVSVNEGNKLNFTVGKVYETDDNMLRCKTDCGYVLTRVKIMNEHEFKCGLVFEEVFDKKEDKAMKFDIKKEKIAVLCDTEEKVEKLCEMLGEKMFKNFHVVNPDACYVGYLEDGMAYDSLGYFKEKEYKLITFEEFIGENKEDNKVEFKVGDRVEILGGTKQKNWCSDGTMKKYIGTKGTIIGIESGEPKFKVKMDIDKGYLFFNTEDLKLASNNQSQQFKSLFLILSQLLRQMVKK